MKKSLYNFLFLCEGDWVLFNLATEEMSLLDAKVKQIYEENDMEGIRRLHPDFYTFLTEKRFAVPDDEDEAAACIARWDREDNDPTTFSLTVNPTLDCNMRCWYCYERHHTDRTMTAEVAASVFKFVERKLAEPELKHFNLAFFGGEPLVEFQSVVKPLVDHACAVADRLGKEVSLSFTTNGYLLTPDVLQYLADTGRHVSFQITLDGNQRLHDRTRHLADGSGSYARILDNCHNLLAQPRTSLTLRCNYTQLNAATFMDLVRDLPDHGITPSEALHIDFQRVWQDRGNDKEVDEQIHRVQLALQRDGYSTSDVWAFHKYRCYAEHNNHIVVNYDGNLFHCTARDFTPTAAEGELDAEGHLQPNEKSAKRAQAKWDNDACRACTVYPLCGGLCSQQKLEHLGVRGCIAGRDEKAKREIAEQRLLQLIEMAKKQPKHN